MRMIFELQEQCVGILLIEQFTDLAHKNANFAVVMRQGAVVFNGSPLVLKGSEDILHSDYFG